MMLRTIILTAAMVVIAGGAQAGDFKVAPHGSHLVDLDTADDNFSLWHVEDLSDINAIRAHMRIARCGKSKKYACQGHIRLLSGDKSVSISVMALKPKAPLYVSLDDGVDDHRQMFMPFPEADEAFDLDIHWSPDGKISFDLYNKTSRSIGQGFERHEYDLGGPIDAMEVSGSTSEVEINKLELGTE